MGVFTWARGQTPEQGEQCTGVSAAAGFGIFAVLLPRDHMSPQSMMEPNQEHGLLSLWVLRGFGCSEQKGHLGEPLRQIAPETCVSTAAPPAAGMAPRRFGDKGAWSFLTAYVFPMMKEVMCAGPTRPVQSWWSGRRCMEAQDSHLKTGHATLSGHTSPPPSLRPDARMPERGLAWHPARSSVT